MHKRAYITRYLLVLDPALFRLQEVSWYGVFALLFGGFAVKLTGGFVVKFHYSFKFKVTQNLYLWIDFNPLGTIIFSL